MLNKDIYIIILSFGISILISLTSSSQEIIEFKTQLDIGEVAFVGKIDSSNAKEPHMIGHYLLLINKGIIPDTIWKNYPGILNNDYVQIIGVYSKHNYCTFLLSTLFEKDLVINKKEKDNSKWIIEGRYTIPLGEKKGRLVGIYIKDEKTIICKYYDLPPEIYKVESGELKKYTESGTH